MFDDKGPVRGEAASDDAAVVTCPGRLDSGLLVLCDHASNLVPKPYSGLGLSPDDLATHIAYDIGAASVARRLAHRFEAPAILTNFSRLLIDPNRGADDPTLVMRVSDRRIIPGNARIDPAEIERRKQLYWRPYRAAIEALLTGMCAQGPVPAVVSIHSFTPIWRGVPRPWEVAVLWDSDPRLPVPLIAALAAQGFVVGDNEPYDGALYGDTLYDEVTRRGLAGALIETRQDLIDNAEKAQAYADLLADIIKPILTRPELHSIEKLQSRVGGA